MTACEVRVGSAQTSILSDGICRTADIVCCGGDFDQSESVKTLSSSQLCGIQLYLFCCNVIIANVSTQDLPMELLSA